LPIVDQVLFLLLHKIRKNPEKSQNPEKTGNRKKPGKTAKIRNFSGKSGRSGNPDFEPKKNAN